MGNEIENPCWEVGDNPLLRFLAVNDDEACDNLTTTESSGTCVNYCLSEEDVDAGNCWYVRLHFERCFAPTFS